MEMYGSVNVWIVTSVRPEFAEPIVYGAWSTHEAAVEALQTCEADPEVTRCYLSHTVVDSPDEF